MKLLGLLVVLAQVSCVLALPAAKLVGLATGILSSPSANHEQSPKPSSDAVNVTTNNLAAFSAMCEANAQVAVTALQQWYVQSTGLWTTTGWWNSANCLTMLADLAIAAPQAYPAIMPVFNNTLFQAPKTNLNEYKINEDSLIRTIKTTGPAPSPVGFLNGYYDDEGWWAMAWIRTFDLTGNPEYLVAAADIFEDMKDGFTAPCGGIWWNKDHTGQVAISNELFLDVSASLANRASFLNDTSLSKDYYLGWAKKEWSFFSQSGMINSDYNINDGLVASTCKNNNATVWSYNQGVILGGLVELNIAAPDSTLLPLAGKIASAALTKLSDSNGILHDPCEPNCGADGAQFKGVFMRNLAILNKATPNSEWTSFIQKNAESVWTNDRNSANQMSVNWAGPFVNPANASTHSSAMDALVAAVALA